MKRLIVLLLTALLVLGFSGCDKGGVTEKLDENGNQLEYLWTDDAGNVLKQVITEYGADNSISKQTVTYGDGTKITTEYNTGEFDIVVNKQIGDKAYYSECVNSQIKDKNSSDIIGNFRYDYVVTYWDDGNVKSEEYKNSLGNTVLYKEYDQNGILILNRDYFDHGVIKKEIRYANTRLMSYKLYDNEGNTLIDEAADKGYYLKTEPYALPGEDGFFHELVKISTYLEGDDEEKENERLRYRKIIYVSDGSVMSEKAYPNGEVVIWFW